MSRAAITVLVSAIALGGAVPADGARAAPRQGIDGQIAAAAGADFPPASAVDLPARRAAVADPDLDGIITPPEAARYYEARFALIDRDRDGRLSGREFLRAAAPPPSPTLDGNLAAPLDFDAVDRDGNGTITPEEFLRTDSWSGIWPTGGGDARREAIFDHVDGDRDGTLSKQEFMDAGAEDFATSDADRDGRVTVWEFYGGKRL